MEEKNTPSPRERLRARVRARIPQGYSAARHLGISLGVCAAAVTLAGWRLGWHLRWKDIAAIPPMLLFLNGFEWWLHKDVLHRRMPPVFLYERHTLDHHMLLRWDDMAIRDAAELYHVLLPVRAIALLALITVPLASIVALLFGAHAAWLYLGLEGMYVALYELTHLSYHLPADHPIAGLRFMRRLAEHHARHHDPRIMRRWNFNVTIPLADLLLGTRAPRELVEKIRAERGLV